MRKPLLIFALLLLSGSLLYFDALASSCMSQPPLYEAFKQADAVFTGTVVKMEKIKVKYDENEPEIENDIFHFQIIEAFKGVGGNTVQINAGGEEDNFYSDFTVGESLLIFADKDEKFFYSGACRRRQSLDFAADEIFFIREMLKGKPESQLYGSIKRGDTFPGTDKTRVTNLANIKITVESSEKRFATATDKNGIFRFNNLPQGKYNLKAIVPSTNGKLRGDEIVFTVAPDKKISYVDENHGYAIEDNYFLELIVKWDNNVSGNIYDAEGKTVKHACAALLPVDLANNRKDLTDKKSFDWECSDDFWLGGETPGQYILAIETFAPFGKQHKIRTFYPQALTVDKAQVFNIQAETQLNFNVKLPAEQTVHSIAGEVVWSNGVSLGEKATAVLTQFEKAANKDVWIYDEASTDESGKFVLQGFEKAEYWLHVGTTVEVTVNGEEKEIEVKAKPLKIKLNQNIDPLKIVLQMPEGIIK